MKNDSEGSPEPPSGNIWPFIVLRLVPAYERIWWQNKRKTYLTSLLDEVERWQKKIGIRRRRIKENKLKISKRTKNTAKKMGTRSSSPSQNYSIRYSTVIRTRSSSNQEGTTTNVPKNLAACRKRKPSNWRIRHSPGRTLCRKVPFYKTLKQPAAIVKSTRWQQIPCLNSI